jgi:hypothetical protein
LEGKSVGLLFTNHVGETGKYQIGLLRGEAEFTMRDLVRYIEAGKGLESIRHIHGIRFCQNGKNTILPDMPKITDLDNLPLPAYDLLPIDAYNQGSQLGESGGNERFFTIMSSRGCPFINLKRPARNWATEERLILVPFLISSRSHSIKVSFLHLDQPC